MSVDYMTRRGALGTLAGAAAAASQAAIPPRRRVGIAGGGMAGVCLAWLLDGERDVVLFEAGPAVGGNIRTIDVTLDGSTFPVDMGAQYFHPGPYPAYVKLLTFLGLYPPSTGESHSFPASISLFAQGEVNPRFVSPVLPGRGWPLLAPWNWDGLGAFAVAFGAAKIREQQLGAWGLSMQDWLNTLGLKATQVDGMVLPWAASLYSGSIDQARALSARAAMIFAAKALPDAFTDPIVYYVLNKGLIEALRRMLLQTSTVQVLTRAAVNAVVPLQSGGFVVRTADGRQVQVDDVVFAAPGPVTSALLSGISGAAALQSAVAGIEFFDAQLALHTSPAYAPANPTFRSFLNCKVEGQFCEASMWMADVLDTAPPTTAAKLWKSWVTHRTQPPPGILHQTSYRHMLPSVTTLSSQASLANLQGQSGVWVAGGYTLPYDSQETAILSAVRVALGLGVSNRRARLLA